MRYYEFERQKFIDRLLQYMKFATVYYPCKVNSDDNLITIVNRYGGSYEADSVRMIELLIKKHKINPNKIIYNYPEKTSRDISHAINLGVRLFVIDSKEDLLNIECNNTSVKYILRLSIKSLINELQSNSNIMDKWGTSVENAKKIISYIKEKTNSTFFGFSFYFPQEYYSIIRVKQSISEIKKIFSDLDEYWIDIGGGISLKDLKIILEDFPEIKERLIVEPGRHLVGDCYDMVCEIVGVHYNDSGQKFIFLNVGIYSGFIDVIIKKHHFDIEPDIKRTGECEEYIVCGSTADISDCFGIYSFPKESVYKGAIFRIKNCGAYCIPMYMSFSGHSKCQIKCK